MLHPFRPQSWCASSEPPWTPSSRNQRDSSASSSPGLAPILGAAEWPGRSCMPYGGRSMLANTETERPIDQSPLPVPTLRARWRAETLPTLRGDLLDVGAGSGNSLSDLSRNARVVCLEPHAASVRTLEYLAGRRPGTRVLQARAERIPLDDASMDAAICCAVLCSVTDQDRALGEIHRVLRPGGRLVLLEHVVAPRGTWTRRGQRLVAPFSRWFDHGCDPARDTEAALARSPFTVVELKRTGARGPFGTTMPHLTGVAVRAT
jgi:SAM-dependent methyltransferase